MLELVLTGSVVPKARPRVSGHAYLPPKYRSWKNHAIGEIKDQLVSTQNLGLSDVSIEVILFGKHQRRGDADNVIGSILDVLVDSKVLKDDNLKCCFALSIRLQYSDEPPWVQIQIS